MIIIVFMIIKIIEIAIRVINIDTNIDNNNSRRNSI